MPKAKNASVAVVLTNSSVMMAVCTTHTGPREASSVLPVAYDTRKSAIELVVLGDFNSMSTDLSQCGHFMKAGDHIGDCFSETFPTYEEYENTINACPYGWNYVFKDGCWWGFISGNKPRYVKLKKKEIKDGKKENKTKG